MNTKVLAPKPRWPRFLILLIIGVMLALVFDRFGPGGRQRRGIEAARQALQDLKPRLAGDPRFAGVKVMITTHPMLYLHGTVPDATALSDLRAQVRPPANAGFGVIWHVSIAPSTQPASVPATQPQAWPQ